MTRGRRDAPLSPAAVRRLRPIPAKGPPPDIALPRALFTIAGAEPPQLTTEVRRIPSDRAGAWQITVGARGLPRRLPAPPRFEIRGIRPPRATQRPSRSDHRFATPAFRPPWIAFEPQPRGTRRFLAPSIRYRGRKLEAISIQGKDDRRTYNDTSYPWGCICRITSGSLRSSGVLIGPRHVLTASHAVDWNAGWAVVEVHRFDATFVSGSCVSRLSAFTKIGKVENSTVDEDYAVLTLFDRLGDQFGWMGSRTYDSSWDEEAWWRTIGYPGDIAGGMRPVYERDFDLDEEPLDFGPARAMTCGADLMPGHSGGPIFGFFSDGVPYVVAVVSAQGGGDNYCAGGSWLPKLVGEVRTLDP